MFSDAALNSAEWIESFAPRWSFSSMVRASPTVKVGKKDGIVEWFDRVRVATLSQDEINHLDQICTNSLRQAIRHLKENPQQINEPKMRFSEDQVKLQSELLSRLCFRFERLDQLFELALDMYKRHIFRDNYPLHHCVDLLFQGLLYAMPQSEILKRIPELLSLPIPGEMGFEISEPRDWSEPFNHIKWEDTELDIKFDHPAWSAPIAKLIRVVTDWRDYEARKRAVIRLKRIYEIGGLTTDECEAFGEALWSRSDESLPSVTGFYDFGFLDLPEIKAGIAKEKFHKNLLSTDSPNIREWLGGTVPLFPKNKEEEQKFVDWTPDEVTQLLNKADTWRDKGKGESQDESIIGRPPIQVQLMAEVILPRLKDADEETKTRAESLLSEMEQSGFCVLYALPMTLFSNPDSYGEIVRKLQDGLNSLKEGEVRDSAFGIFRWLVHGSRQSISAPPDDLLNELVNRVVTRRQPGLDSVIQCVSEIVRRLPELLNEGQMGSLCVALGYLIKETELPEIQDREAISRVRLTIPITDRPEYRKLAAELAYRLFSHVTMADKEAPQILSEWKEICQNDPLPEVKRVGRLYCCNDETTPQ